MEQSHVLWFVVLNSGFVSKSAPVASSVFDGSVGRDMKQAEFVRWLSTLDGDTYKTNASAVSSAANPEKSKVVYGELPVTHRIVRLLKLLVKQYPKFEYERLFKRSAIAELRRLMT